MITAGITKSRKQKTYEIVPEVIEVIHAAGRIIPAKLLNSTLSEKINCEGLKAGRRLILMRVKELHYC